MAARKKTIAMPDPPKRKPRHKLRGEHVADDIATYQRLDDEIQAAESALKKLKADRDDFEQFVLDRMAYERLPSIRCTTTGRTFYVNHQRFAKVQDRSEFTRWAQEEAPELLLQVREAKGDLNTELRRRDDDGEDLPPGTAIYWDTKLGSRA